MSTGCRFTKRYAFGKLARSAAVVGAIALWSLVPLARMSYAQPSPEPSGAAAAAPLKVGLSVSLSGAEAENGRQVLIALELWRDEVNAKGGLLGRRVDLIHYDDQSNPAVVPGIYYKLITTDKADLLLGPYGRNTAAAAMRVLLNFNKSAIGILGIGVNRVFSYRRYFSMAPFGSDGVKALSKGFFDLAAEQMPRPKTVAILGGDAEFTALLAASARDNAGADGFNVIYDERYPDTTTDFVPVMRLIKAANPDVLFLAADQSHTAGIIAAATEGALNPGILGGVLLGLLNTPIKVGLGPELDGLIAAQNLVPARTLAFPGLAELMKRYRLTAAQRGSDPIGYSYAPFAYAAGQVLAQAVEETHGIDPDGLAGYIHSHRFTTVVGNVEYDGDGEWSAPRPVFAQYRNIAKENVEQFAAADIQPIVWPPQYRTDNAIYPYAAASKR
jgi:branched-chain amino acid transport system substrate-binding protein